MLSVLRARILIVTAAFQVLHMLQGSAEPGSAFVWNQGASNFEVAEAIHVGHHSLQSLRSLLQSFAVAGSCARRWFTLTGTVCSWLPAALADCIDALWEKGTCWPAAAGRAVPCICLLQTASASQLHGLAFIPQLT